MVTVAHASGMDVVALRRANLARWLQDDYGGNKSQLARELGYKNASFVIDLINGKKSFGEKVARSIERRLGKSRGDLDTPPGGIPGTIADGATPYRANRWPFAFDQARYSRLTQTQQHKIEEVVLAMVEKCEADSRRPKRMTRVGGRQ